MKLPVALTIAGSDSGGGAGIQADLKTFAALGCHGTSALTAVTVQDTQTVHAFVELPLEIITGQIDAVVTDLAPAAAKTGMLASAQIIEVVAERVRHHRLERLVVDPVMVAKGGAHLLRQDAVDALRARLLPLAAVLTPNIPEAEVLLGRRLEDLEDRRRGAAELLAMGPQAVVLKGGHAEHEAMAVDVYADRDGVIHLFSFPRHQTANTHGSGCTFAAAITAGLAHGASSLEAVTQAKRFIAEAIKHAVEVGHGHGPVNPMFMLSGRSRDPFGEATRKLD